MTYTAVIESSSGERRALKLGRCSGMGSACEAAKTKAPQGWRVIDVRGNR